MLNVESSSDKQQKSFNKVLLDDSKLSIENYDIFLQQQATASQVCPKTAAETNLWCDTVTVCSAAAAAAGIGQKTRDYKLNFLLQKIAETFILTNC